MELFHIIDDAQAIVKQNGIYRQLKVYRRESEIFVAIGMGFIKLMARGASSVPSLTWIDIDAKGVEIHADGSHKSGTPIFKKDK